MMQLSELIETHGIDTIRKQTHITKKDLEALVDNEFNKIPRVKALGFIGILEREFKVVLTDFRANAMEYYDFHEESSGNISVGIPMQLEQKKKSRLLSYIAGFFMLIGLWFFWQKFQQHGMDFKKYITEKEVSIEVVKEEVEQVKIEAPQENKKSNVALVNNQTQQMSVKNLINSITETNGTNAKMAGNIELIGQNVSVNQGTLDNTTATLQNHGETSAQMQKTVVLTPKRKLWFGVINLSDNKREHFIKAEPYTFDVSNNNWLVATSSAYFSLTNSGETTKFSDAKPHYFRVDKTGATELTKEEFLKQGGWRYW